jgi:glycosyltransferase involved in cell wall biosynthesis
MLDIIVTHWNEPWETGKKFFDMLGCQRGIDFSQFQVILVHDGGRKFPQHYFWQYPYRVTQYTIPHGGVSAARNYGLDMAKDKWVEFCDFDDMYSGAYSLRMILEHMEKDIDYMWVSFLTEYEKNGELYVKETGENIVFVHGKYFRREWLIENGIRFPEGIHYSEDSGFCAIVNEMALPDRRGRVKTKFPIYIWCVRKDSVSMKPENVRKNMTGFLDRNFYVVEEFIRRGIPHRLMVGRMFADAYWAFHQQAVRLPEEEERFAAEARQYVPDLRKNSAQDMENVMNAARVFFTGMEEENPEPFDTWVDRIMAEKGGDENAVAVQQG